MHTRVQVSVPLTAVHLTPLVVFCSRCGSVYYIKSLVSTVMLVFFTFRPCSYTIFSTTSFFVSLRSGSLRSAYRSIWLPPFAARSPQNSRSWSHPARLLSSWQ